MNYVDYLSGQRQFKDMTEAELRHFVSQPWPPANYANWPLSQKLNYIDFGGSITRSNAESAREELLRRGILA
jgi:hypothetical protein